MKVNLSFSHNFFSREKSLTIIIPTCKINIILQSVQKKMKSALDMHITSDTSIKINYLYIIINNLIKSVNNIQLLKAYMLCAFEFSHVIIIQISITPVYLHKLLNI